MARVVPGSLKVSNDCIADLAGYAALECYGVVGMTATDEQEGIVRLLPTYRLRKGVGVSVQDGRVVVDLHVMVEMGINMSSVSDNLVSSVKFLLAQIAELKDVDVRVHIDGMRIATAR
ncbi:Asp23/Gls24 family envelope stress response protein [Olsenella urininfantis]|uniref:Asp23/Gls24 family envelope stress response protein n=1 Tax=Olsenella urininfantis TaxID=1871033 RepID=UPI0009854A16|nr:Asp23/Gls24 family envelope stress response protein [Olsenella urininfantis]